MGTLPLGLFPFLTDVLLPHLQTGPGQITHAYHTVEDGALSTLVSPRHCRPLGGLTLFQQPWTGKPSSPCSEEGRHMAQILPDGPSSR